VWSKAKLGLPQDSDFRRLGVFGGAFDPIHFGHLICAEQLREVLDLDMVLFVPCGTPPHKPGYTPASAEHRLAMARLAIADYRRFALSDMEIERGGISYTTDTVRHLREALGAAVELWLLMGLDAWLDLPTWKDLDQIVAECFFGVAGRPGYSRESLRGMSVERTRFVDITPVKISASDIRMRLAQSRSVKYLVPAPVERYIMESRPYPQASQR
jgi:nicotinate-nucleotide adenylyltransferase